MNKDWYYYNHAILPMCAPDKEPDLEPINDGTIWNTSENKPLLARWTTDFDCGYETAWWYVIKDTSFDLSRIKAKRRYEINKGIKNFDAREINPVDHISDICEIQKAAFAAYPKKYRDIVDYTKLKNEIPNWKYYKIYGVFYIETGKLCGYSILNLIGCCISFDIQKTIPEYEPLAINAALVYKIVIDNNDLLNNGYYICDGSRNINHETKFQEYLIKYFEFRYAYCVLHVKYRPIVKFAVRILYPFRKLLKRLDNLTVVHNINGVLNMESIVRSGSKGK